MSDKNKYGFGICPDEPQQNEHPDGDAESSFAAPTLLGHVTPECLDAEDWLQVEMASRGCVSGTLNEWTKLRRAMLAAGLEAWPTMPSSAMRDVCRLLMSHCPNAGVSDRRDNPKR